MTKKPHLHAGEVFLYTEGTVMKIRSLMLFVFTATVLLPVSFVHAQVLAPSPPASTDFCAEWFQQKNSGALEGVVLPGNALAVVIQALKIRFFPSSYAEPEFLTVPTGNRVRDSNAASLPQDRQAQNTSAPTSGKNIIFFVGAPPEVLSSETRRTANAKLKQMQREVHPLLGSILKLAKTPDVASCQRLEAKMNFNYDNYTNLVDENGNLRDDQQIANENSSLKDLKSAIHASRLGWETLDYTDLSDVYAALRDPQIENVIIVSHGQTNSLIVDSRWNEFPQHFFHNIAPHLRSLNFYSCYSKTVPAKYGLSDLFAKAPSIYRNRLITTVQSNPKVYEAGMAPLNGFKHYLEGVEKKISELKVSEAASASPASSSSTASGEISALPNYTAPADCSVQFRAPTITSGTYGFFLNLKYIGSVGTTNPAGTPVLIHFPCSMLSLAKNILTNRNINTAVVYAEIAGKPFEITQWVDPEGSTVVQTNHYQTSTGTYQSSKWEIDVATSVTH
jgi:hypothetical protein